MKLRRKRGALTSEINVTPLVDVVLVLLIIFLVVTPYLYRGVEVRLPSAHHAVEPDATSGPLVVTIASDGVVYLGTDPIDRPGLLEAIRSAREERPDRELLVRGDERTRYGDVEELLSWLRASGAPYVALATRLPE